MAFSGASDWLKFALIETDHMKSIASQHFALSASSDILSLSHGSHDTRPSSYIHHDSRTQDPRTGRGMHYSQ